MSDSWKPSPIELSVLLTIKASKVNIARGLHDTEIIKKVRKPIPKFIQKTSCKMQSLF